VNRWPPILVRLPAVWALLACGTCLAEERETIQAPSIVSLAPFLTELVYAVGAGDRLLGADRYSDYPPAARAVPRIGDAWQLDIERIVALRPSVVLAWTSGNAPAAVAQLRQLGLRVEFFDPQHLAEVAAALERIGELTGRTAAGTARAAEFRAAVEALHRRYRGRQSLTVFYQVSRRPLFTLNGEHLVSEVLALCGGVNPFAALPARAPEIDVEALLAADPEVIIAGSKDAVELEAWRAWDGLKAVRHGQLYLIDPDLIVRQGPRLIQGIEQICTDLETARAAYSRPPALRQRANRQAKFMQQLG